MLTRLALPVGLIFGLSCIFAALFNVFPGAYTGLLLVALGVVIVFPLCHVWSETR